ncbi:tachykinins isoform X2 [Atheta coriaria]
MRIPHITLLLATVCLVTGSDSHKRAPSGFTGVRGKKSITDSEYANVEYPAEKRVSAGFFGDQQKPFDGWAEKRVPASGFLGVRGKKDSENDFDKRAPSGFLGMRGKKEFDPYGHLEKRAPSGFLGMRGKKDNEMLDDELKRAPAAGFFGVRGKKEPTRASFFGMRGKKYPYEFRGKFVGVRGKKASEEASKDYTEVMQQVGKDLDINQLMLLLTENEPYNNPDNVYQYFNNINN